MLFEKYHLYHIYNRGNISQRIFFSRNNYVFFLKKIRRYITPYADVLAWCLMPNHFHLMVHVNHTELSTDNLASNKVKTRTLNDSIGIMLRTYTRAIQKQESTNGSLFQEHTKAACLTQTEGLDQPWFDLEFGTMINISTPEKEYPSICFEYIHQNPVAAGLSVRPKDWEFCSFPDYYEGRKGTLINKERAKEFGLI